MKYLIPVENLPAFDFKKFKKLTPLIYEKTIRLSRKIKGKKVVHINSVSYGGGVAEMLRSQIPLENSLGLNSLWYTLSAPLKFFNITKKIHNLLQGKKAKLSENEKKYYLNWISTKAGKDFCYILEKESPDILIIHDPQPLPLISLLSKSKKQPRIILRLHLDLSTPEKNTLKFLKKFILRYNSVILSHPDYKFSWLDSNKVEIIYPAINPFSVKNRPMKLSQAKEILFTLGVHSDKPIISQVSRFDPWKDPLGAIQSYYLAKREIPNLCLILAGIFFATDDPEAKKIFKEVKKHTEGDPDIYLFSDPYQLKNVSNDLFINAVYTISTVVLQKSIREGFGLTVTEAMWKKKPVIGGETKGISLQITHNKNGFLVKTPYEAADYIVKLFKDKKLRKRIGEYAHKTVKEKFLISRLILDHLRIYRNVRC